jgi:hypothetical protein
MKKILFAAVSLVALTTVLAWQPANVNTASAGCPGCTNTVSSVTCPGCTNTVSVACPGCTNFTSTVACPGCTNGVTFTLALAY